MGRLLSSILCASSYLQPLHTPKLNVNSIDPQIQREVSRRRTFAIISHPDAGKTTLTEKLLLFGGCIDVAGAVRGRKNQRAATSDWMELEKQRGISVSSTVLTFEFEDAQSICSTRRGTMISAKTPTAR